MSFDHAATIVAPMLCGRHWRLPFQRLCGGKANRLARRFVRPIHPGAAPRRSASCGCFQPAGNGYDCSTAILLPPRHALPHHAI